MPANRPTASAEKRVLIFPARIPKFSDRQVYFLFSLRQMVDILVDATVQPVPFSPDHLEGVAEWRGQVLPVVSMETYLGFQCLNTRKIQRMMVVRAIRNSSIQTNPDRIILRAIPPIQMLTLPIDCSPAADDWIPENRFARGVYEWGNKLLVTAHLEHILFGGN